MSSNSPPYGGGVIRMDLGNSQNPVQDNTSISHNNGIGKEQPNKVLNVQKPHLYSDKVYVFIQKRDEDGNLGKIHPMKIGHIFHKTLSIPNIVSISSVGRNRVKIDLKSISDANKLINDDRLIKEDLVAFIPNNLLQRKGIIRNVDTSFDEKYILENVNPSVTVTEVSTFKKKLNIDGGTTFVNRQTVLLSFEGNTLPTHIFINSVACPVEPDVHKVI
ncbi:unnamed protein product [Acanthoscelides obtectus]|uniref:Uncharacterized protein n=1 Tax=Acanthoscelides obtectus TaxID=200917 RepID=A0A9P0M792_ACAOB|nr:unnamed protein product [Acanthoscelides obtectus]CAK1652127.1 hypothetical protein AOBTE_LOCUS17702 [Acanthoscelides obtectus]